MSATTISRAPLTPIQRKIVDAIPNQDILSDGIEMANGKTYSIARVEINKDYHTQFYSVEVTPKDDPIWTGKVPESIIKFFATVVAKIFVVRTRDKIAQELADQRRYNLLIRAQHLHTQLLTLGSYNPAPSESQHTFDELDKLLNNLRKSNDELVKFIKSCNDSDQDASTVLNQLRTLIEHELTLIKGQMEKSFAPKHRVSEPSNSFWVVVCKHNPQSSEDTVVKEVKADSLLFNKVKIKINESENDEWIVINKFCKDPTQL